jgi:hypothetical protein
VATTSITQAVISMYEALTAANFPSATVPRIDFGEAPQNVSGVALVPPYVTLQDLGRERKPADFEGNTFVTTRFVFEVWANTLDDVDTIVAAIQRNGGTAGQGLGFDYGTLTGFTTASGKTGHQILPVTEPRKLTDRVDKNGQRIHGSALEYKVTVLESA